VNIKKWIKSIEEEIINVKNQIYMLKITSNKRKVIYDSNNKLVNTISYNINDIKLL
jgi:hypothetical protein